MPRRPPIRCPSCGYCPAKEDRWNIPLHVPSEPPKTFMEQVDCFEVCGCDEGNVMCPKCAKEFNPRKRKLNV